MSRRNLAVLLFVQACSTSGAVVQGNAPAAPAIPVISAEAQRIYRDAIVVDVHNDLPSKMIDDGYSADVRHAPGFAKDQGETDLPRLVESGITGQFLSAWVDALYALGSPDQSWHRVQVYLDTIHAFVNRHPNHLVFATTARQVRDAKTQGKVAMLIGVEGGHAIESSLDHLRELHRRGVRYMTLTWNNGNAWAGSSIGVNGTRTGGLTDFGRQVVREMNRLGMLADISHVSDSTFFDVIATTADPVIASHSSARAINGHPRNMSDDQLRAIARNGGVVNVNFYSNFLDPRFRASKDSIDRRYEAESQRDAAVRTLPRPPLAALLDHIDHIARVAGVDHVGLGSDFDGVGGLLPAGLDDVTRMPLIAQGLLARGYSERDIRKILGGNMLRVMQRVLDR